MNMITDNGMIVGVMPRFIENKINLQKCENINQRLKTICLEKGIKFIETGEIFNKVELFSSDKIHLNNKGKNRLANLLSDVLLNHTKEEVDCRKYMEKMIASSQEIRIESTNNNFQELHMNMPKEIDKRETLPKSGAIPKVKRNKQGNELRVERTKRI